MTTMGSTGSLVGGRYRLDAVLGRGGMGVVWSGVDTLLERPVALKEINLPPALDEAERQRYQARVLREARAAARLNHRSVVTVYDVVDEADQPFIVMELVRAPSLAEVVAQNGPLSPERVADLGIGIAEALGAAHRAGIIHRDVKPANVLVPDSGPARLTDFGIASLADDTGATTTQRLVGSPSYMSPEQAANHPLTEASDRWSLGSTLYYAVEGVPAFDRGEAIPTLTSILSDPPRPPERAGPLGPVLLDLLAKEPSDRPSDDALLASLRAVAGRTTGRTRTVTSPSTTAVLTPPHSPPPAPSPRAAAPVSSAVGYGALGPQRSGRSPLLIGATAVVALLVAVTAFALLHGPHPSTPANSAAVAVGPPASSAPSTTPSTTGPPKPTTVPSSAPAAADVPANWVSYRDSATGFAIAHPPGWTVSTNGSQTNITDPTTGAYLRVDHISPPHANAEADWRSYEPSFAASNPGYQRIQITPTTFDGFPAAIWEYTYGGGGSSLHAVDLGFVVGSAYGFALNYQTPAGEWQRMQPEFQAFQRSFRAPA